MVGHRAPLQKTEVYSTVLTVSSVTYKFAKVLSGSICHDLSFVDQDIMNIDQ